LNWFGVYAEAIPYCRAAIVIDPNRHNAFKNLGVALQGERQYSEAADAYIKATRICPRDGRAQRRLEHLLSKSKEHLGNLDEIMVELKRCRDLVEKATIH
jgi:tetratricopeptide (TPR) repeat protein